MQTTYRKGWHPKIADQASSAFTRLFNFNDPYSKRKKFAITFASVITAVSLWILVVLLVSKSLTS